ncbi:MAG: hypothetical protein RLY97_913 [Pseudomonadota bacterium]|jgi:feruloyl esterase
MRRYLIVILSTLLAIFSISAPVQARDLPAIAPKISCNALSGWEFTAEHTKVLIQATEEISAEKLPNYCKVSGLIAPQTHFELRLPTANWQQRMLFTGCGGFCGFVKIRPQAALGCPTLDNGSMVTVATDMGHTANVGDTSWASGNAEARANFGHRAVHLTTVAAKAIVAHFYGQASRYHYFSGCSDGGREAMIEAQRYPHDYNGIIAGAAVINHTANNSIYHAWLAQHLYARDGTVLFSAAQLLAVKSAATAQCDAQDGQKDGFIAQPWSCDFKPESLKCGPKNPDNCLSDAQVALVSAIYTGPVSAAGKPLYFGAPIGSEANWISQGKMSQNFGTSFITNFTGETASTPVNVFDTGYTAANIAKYNHFSSILNATSPNLARFFAAGGKLILWHGAADSSVPMGSSLAYYHKLHAKFGKATGNHAKLYMLPAVGHCGGGDGPDQLDLLSKIMAWIEDRQAPSALVAHTKSGAEWHITPFHN